MSQSPKSNEELFQKEVKICQSCFGKGGCNWGRCADCGVIPLLYKIYKGEHIEDQARVIEIKKELGWN